MDYKDIAVVGIGCRVSSAKNVKDFIQILKNNECTIGSVPEKRLDLLGLDKSVEYIKYSYLDNVEYFDYNFFGINKTEAESMNPEQKIILETACEALWDAGYSTKDVAGKKISVYIAVADNYWEDVLPKDSGVSFIGNTKGVAAGRIAYQLDLHGPAYTIDTTCSSSLAAIHNVCMQLQTGEVDAGLAGGINVLGIIPSKKESDVLGIASSDGITRSFDENSDGTGGGEGVGIVYLKRLVDAIRDKDHIYAVIKGSSANSDGGRSSNIAAPSPEAQSAVICEALERAAINPETITCIEAHGTGTRIGDPIEVKGITEAYQKYTDKKKFCALTAVKSNIGHTGCAAGVLSFIKAAVSVSEGIKFPLCNFVSPNSFIDFDETPVYPQKELESWDDDVRRCGISSFGLSGTNVHIIIENYKEPSYTNNKKSYVFTTSGKTEASLNENINRYINHLKEEPYISISSLSYVMNTGREKGNYSVAFCADSIETCVEKLSDCKKQKKHAIKHDKKVVLLCSGNTADEYLFAVHHLKEKGVCFDVVLGNSKGNFVVQYLSGKISLDEASKKIKEYTGNPLEVSAEKFKLAIIKLVNESECIFLELGKDGTLMELAQETLDDTTCFIQASPDNVNQTICKLYLAGAAINWNLYYKEDECFRVSLPTYAFDRSYCWPKNINVLKNHDIKQDDVINTGQKAVIEHVRAIWGEVLGTDNFKDDDDFLEVGGSSLMHMQIISRVKATIGVELTYEEMDENYTVKMLSDCIDKKLKEQETFHNESSIKRISRDNKMILSSTQDSMICIYERQPESSAYNMSTCFKLEGRIEPKYIEKAFLEVVKKHEILRTVYEKIDGIYYQKILSENTFKLKLESAEAYGNDDELIWESINKDFHKGFDLEKEIPIRVRLVMLNKTEGLLSIQLHHICADSWSVGIVLDEFISIYDAMVKGSFERLEAKDELDYVDYATWQRAFLDGDAGKTKIKFWEEYLKDIPAYLDFPITKKRTGLFGEAKKLALVFDEELSKDVKRAIDEYRVSIYEFMLAAYGVLLYRYSHQDDFCIGIVSANRMTKEFEQVVGFFANTLAVRFKVDGNIGFKEFVTNTKHMLKELFSNQEIPFEEIVRKIQPKRDSLYAPVFQHSFTMKSFKDKESKSDLMKLEEIKLGESNAKFDFLFVLDPTDENENIRVDVEYDSSLFEEEQISRILKNYKELVRAVISNPNEPVNSILFFDAGKEAIVYTEESAAAYDF
ncbi:MAG: hypothetical protein K5769_03285 [Pseudobutyrivibrio sp.]|nr:hypothetical protein [Pseudobutyrivibrio sp.]